MSLYNDGRSCAVTNARLDAVFQQFIHRVIVKRQGPLVNHSFAVRQMYGHAQRDFRLCGRKRHGGKTKILLDNSGRMPYNAINTI